MSENDLSRQEMDCYCRYLLGKNADESSLQLFARAIRREETTLSPEEIRLLKFMISNGWCVSLIDAAMGVFYPQHRLRKRMTIAFAILENNPLYYDSFGPKVFSGTHFIALLFHAVREGLAALIGRIILSFF